jgi:general nucleoside transport system permease protein
MTGGGFWHAVLSVSFLVAVVTRAAPIAFAAVGEVVSERAGVINVGLEGYMLAGAFGGVAGATATGSPVVGALLGLALGAALALVHAFVTQSLRADQVVSGIALNLISLGLTGFAARQIWGLSRQPSPHTFHAVAVPGLSQIPVVGPVLFDESALFYVLVVATAVTAIIIVRTRWGLSLRGAGESEVVATSLGVNVIRVRYVAVVVCGALAGLGGVFISLVNIGSFQEGITGGQGFIALAAVIFSGWRPWIAVGGAVLFGVSEAVGFQLQATTTEIPVQLVNALPFVVTLLVFVFVVGRHRKAPGALGIAPEAR